MPPIRGSGWLPQPKPEPHRRQRPALRPHQGPPAKSPEALPPPKASFAGESVFLQGAAQTGGKGRAARFRGYFQGVPQTRGKTHAERWIRSRSVPQAGGRGSAPSTITASAGRPHQKRGESPYSRRCLPAGMASPTETRRKQQHLAAIFRGWLAYPDRRQRPDHAERGRAAYTSQIRGKGRHKLRASARHRHTPQTGGTGGARPHIKAGGRCRPSARPPPAGHPSWARNPPGRLRRPCAALPIPKSVNGYRSYSSGRSPAWKSTSGSLRSGCR